MFIIYSKSGCPDCEKAKSFIRAQGDAFQEIVIGRDLSREEFMEIYPGVRSVPYIVLQETVETYSDRPVGGFENLREFYKMKTLGLHEEV